MAEIPVTKISKGEKLLIVNTPELQMWIDDGWEEVKPTPPPKGDKPKK